MTDYTGFCGIDIGKFSFFVAFHGDKTAKEYGNDEEGIAAFIADYQARLANAFCVLEVTGGYELALLYALLAQGIAVHRADGRKVKHFIRSYGQGAKTDRLDARALADYARERHSSLPLFCPASQCSLELFALVQRRSDLKQMLVAEKNRLKAPSMARVKASCQAMIDILAGQIKTITAEIKTLVQQDPRLQQKLDTLKTIPGIGDIVAFELLVRLPELGTLDRKKIAALAGLAPFARESGSIRGYRKTGHGRNGIKPILFLAAMAARNSKSHLRTVYENMIKRGKHKMVVLTAIMRKIITIANAKLKENELKT